MQYVFGDYRLDMERYELQRAGSVVPLDRQGFAVLTYLIAHRDRVVLRQELFERLWADRFVSDAALERCLAVIRRAVGDSGQRQEVIKTVHGRGYRFVAALTVASSAAGLPADLWPAPSRPPSGPEPGPGARADAAGAAPVERHPHTALGSTPPRLEPPRGTVTLLFSDLEHSTRLLQHLGEQYADVLAAYQRLLREAFQAWDGYEIDTAGDGFFVAFQRATHAVAAAVAAQRAVAGHPWPEGAPVRVRMGLHTGEPTRAAGGYVGLDVHRAARIGATGHGGQTLLSQTTRALVADDLPAGVRLRDLGEHRLKDLQRPERLYQLVMPDVPSAFPPLRSLDQRAHNLPVQPTPLIGREQLGAAACALLRRAEVRLLTLTGPGGTGKTRLSLQVAADLLEDFANGVSFVPLAAIRDAALVASSIARTLGLQEKAGQWLLDSLREHLRDQQMLLVLDNFEQVVAAAPLVTELLAACPRLKCLVTSREVLRLSGEHEFPVPPLDLPDPSHLPAAETVAQYGAVALFIQRALAVQPDFRVDNATAPAVAAICVRLDGLPLAIELAAARLKLLPPQAILARLGRRFELLRGGARDVPERHQTLRQAIAWSYDLLEAGERALFRRLAVFARGYTLEAAEAVCQAVHDAVGGPEPSPEVLDGVASLLDKSLLRQQEQASGEPRFHMLETIREYGLECLTASGEEPAARHAHADYFLALVEVAEPALMGPDQATWLARLEAEHDNLRAALRWAEESREAEIGWRLAGALCQFWLMRGHLREGQERLARLLGLPLPAPRTAARAKALTRAGHLADNLSDYAAAHAFFEESLAIRRALGDAGGIAAALNDLGWVAFHRNDYTAARMWSEESLAIWRELGDNKGIATSLNNLGFVAYVQGEYTATYTLFQESLALRRALGDKWGIAVALVLMGRTVHLQGDYRQATARLEEGRALFRELGAKQLFAYTSTYLGGVAHDQGNDERATALLEEGVTLFRDTGDREGLALTLSFLGTVVHAQGDNERATALYEESLSLSTAIGYKWDMALALCRLGTVAHVQGDDNRATALYEESLALYRELGNKHGLAECLEGLAGVAVAQRQLERAARLLGAAETLRQATGAPLSPGERVRYDRDVSAVRAGLGEAACAAAWATGKACPWSTSVHTAVDQES
jgi:predicted ATPase/class 3 adenylate cyclase/DNA-binding winged helix-turn-helix (wHTH) protein